MELTRKAALRWLAGAMAMAALAVGLHLAASTLVENRLFIWWEEDRSAAMARDYEFLKSRAAEAEHALEEEKRAGSANESRLTELSAESVKLKGFLSLHKRREPRPWNDYTTATLTLPGNLPEAERSRLTGDGWLEEKEWTAAFRLVVDWEGRPVAPERCASIKPFEKEELPAPVKVSEALEREIRSYAPGPRDHGDMATVSGVFSPDHERSFNLRRRFAFGAWFAAGVCFTIFIVGWITGKD